MGENSPTLVFDPRIINYTAGQEEKAELTDECAKVFKKELSAKFWFFIMDFFESLFI